MKVAVFGWIMLCFVLHQDSECVNIRGRQSTKIKNEWKNKKTIYKIQAQEKISATTGPKVKRKDTEEMIFRRIARSKSLKQKRSSTSSKIIDCCPAGKVISLPRKRKDVLVKNAQNIHFARKIIVGSQFRELLRALYQNHSNDVQAIKRKMTNGQVQLLGSKGEDENDKVNIYSIEGKSDASKNKTIIELRAAILKLLNKVAKRAKSAHNSQQRDQKEESSTHSSTRKKFGNTVKTEIQESYGQNRAPASFEKPEDISAKRANYMDLLNFISQMKNSDIGKDVDLYSTNEIQRLNRIKNNGLNGNLNSQDTMAQSLLQATSPMPDLRNAPYQNGFLPGEGRKTQEMNPLEERGLLEDQLENRVAPFQSKAQLQRQQQGVSQLQNLQNGKMTNFIQNLQNAIATPFLGTIPLRFWGPAAFQQPLFIPRVNPYLPFARPFPRTGTGLPFLRPVDPRLHPPDDEEEDDDSDEGDNADDDDDYHRNQNELPPHHQMREHEESNNDYDDDDDNDDEEEESDFDNDGR